MLPIVQRELQVAARSRRFYLWRLRTGALLTVGALFIVLGTRGTLSRGENRVFQTLCFCALLLCIVEGIRKTSDAISEEKREGTLGLLFLTSLGGFDIILGKLTAAAVRSFNGLLAFVPLLAVSLLLGGTTGGEFWRSVLVLLATLGASLSVCILTSTVSQGRSMAAAVQALLALSVLPLVATLLPNPSGRALSSGSPFRLIELATDLSYQRSPMAFWSGLLWLAGVMVASAAAASVLVSRVWQDRPRPPGKRVSEGSYARACGKRAKLLDENPAVWLLCDPGRQRSLKVLTVIIGGACWIGLLLSHLLMPRWNIDPPLEVHLAFAAAATLLIVFVTFLYAAREASANLAEARGNGALELILSTPLTTQDIIRGQILAIRRGVRWPTLVVMPLIMYALTIGAYTEDISFFLLSVKSVAEAILGYFVVVWVGLWMGLTSKGATRAILKTVGVGVLVPFLFCLPTLVNQIVLLAIAADRVKVNFRRYVAERYLPNESFGLPPVQTSGTAPPVIR